MPTRADPSLVGSATNALAAGAILLAHLHPAGSLDRLFRTAAAATQQLARDPRFIGGQIGLVGVLHSWTRGLRYHAHVHYLVPAGGLAADGQTWCAARRNCLLPVKALSRLFRGHFREAAQTLPAFANIPAKVWTHAWVVHCKPVGRGQAVLKYLAPYIYRVALSNRRLVKLEDGRVTFRYQDSQTHQTKCCTLPVGAFIHRSLQHVLPKGFVKVRYYGFFAPGRRRQLAALQQHLGPQASGSTDCPDPAAAPVDPQSRPTQRIGDEVRCPVCARVMAVRQIRRPSERCPP